MLRKTVSYLVLCLHRTFMNYIETAFNGTKNVKNNSFQHFNIDVAKSSLFSPFVIIFAAADTTKTGTDLSGKKLGKGC